MPSPNVSSYFNTLNGVAPVASDDVWAAGYADDPTGTYLVELIEHWNGSQWSVVPGPTFAPGAVSLLNGVAAVSANDIWAVGGADGHPVLTQHWDGSQWSVVPNPDPCGTTSPSELYGVSARSATDVWAVGQECISNSTPSTLIEHWDGAHWSLVSSPNPGNGSYLLNAVSVAPNGTAYAVGNGQTGGSILIERWHGQNWTMQTLQSVPSPEYSCELHGAAALSYTDAWAVGFCAVPGNPGNPNGGSATLAEHYQPISASGVPFATPTP